MSEACEPDERVRLAPDAVLILGAGLAGLSLARALSPSPTLVVAPRPPGEAAASAWAQGGIAAALGPDDAPALHLADTIAAGAGLVDEAAARALCEAGPDAVRALAALGAPFDRAPDGRFDLSLEAAHSRARVARVSGDRAGAAILAAVAADIAKTPSVELRTGLRATTLLTDENGAVAGALCEDADGRAIAIEAGRTALALGGSGGLFAVTTNPRGALGTGLAMAARAGGVIADAEFVQFHPTAIDVGLDPAPLATEALRGEGARLIDREGRPLSADEGGDLAARDAVARAVHAAIADGRGAFLDARTAVGAAFPEHFPTVFAACRKAGLDPRAAPIPVAPAAHYHMGGAATDPDGRTTLEGLWAFGECACTGAHGANRLASNSLLEAVVTPARAARAMKAQAPGRRGAVVPTPPPPQLPAQALERVRTAMAAHAGVIRNAEGLGAVLTLIDELEHAHGETNPLLAAKFITRAAAAREESRGAHWRADFPAPAPIAQRSRLTTADLGATLDASLGAALGAPTQAD